MANGMSPRRQFLKSLSLTAAASVAVGVPMLAEASPSKRRTFAETFLPTWERAKSYTVQIAEAMPEEHYNFKPVPEVRSFAEQLLHIAGSCAFFAGRVSGLTPPTQDFEVEGKSKAEIVALTTQIFDYCSKAIGTISPDDTETLEFFGQNLTKEQVILFMRDHVTHHRGQTVTYLRLKGFTPPQYVGF